LNCICINPPGHRRGGFCVSGVPTAMPVTKPADRNSTRTANRASWKRSLDRYNLTNARTPPNGLADPPRTNNVPTAVVAVPDPLETGKRITARVNTRVDLLETERARGRISEAAFSVGRDIQRAFERVDKGPVSGSFWRTGGKTDAPADHDAIIKAALEEAARAIKLVYRLEKAIGYVGARFMRRLLIGEATFRSEAVARGRGNEGGIAGVAERFRAMLEDLAEDFDAAGR
jgi:hypothetical protein